MEEKNNHNASMGRRVSRIALWWILPMVLACGATVAFGYLAGTYGAGNYGADTYGTGDVTPPVISNISSNTPGQTSVTITWTTDENSTSQVAYGADSSYGSLSTLNTTLASTTHSVVLTGLSQSTTYHFAVASVDPSGNAATSSDQIFVSSSTPDTTAPSVSVSNPASGAVIGGHAATMSATASDDIAVGGVTFWIDSVLVGSEVTAFPYTVTFDTTGLSEGSHSIVAVARDTSNNYATSSSLSFIVDNTPPLVDLSAPLDGGTITGSAVSFSADASDTNAVAGVQFKVDNTPLGSEITSSPYTASIDSTALSNGSHSFVAVARDTAGNYATSSVALVVVSNVVVSQPTPVTGGGGGIYGSGPLAPGYVNTTPYATTTVAVVASSTGQTQTTTGTVSLSPATPFVFTGDLGYGTTGNEVQQLQMYLNGHNFILADSSYGSPGNETTYFGPLTRAALAKFQAANNITPASGFFGPATRAIITGESQSTAATTPMQTTTSTTVSTPLSATSFTRDLTLDDTGPDVLALQQYLNSQGFILANYGPGSKGNETSKFEYATQYQLSLFQQAHGITPATGYFGSSTRTFIAGH